MEYTDLTPWAPRNSPDFNNFLDRRCHPSRRRRCCFPSVVVFLMNCSNSAANDRFQTLVDPLVEGASSVWLADAASITRIVRHFPRRKRHAKTKDKTMR